jgi:hypothetical protein
MVPLDGGPALSLEETMGKYVEDSAGDKKERSVILFFSLVYVSQARKTGRPEFSDRHPDSGAPVQTNISKHTSRLNRISRLSPP